jgi:hypothetical protein
MNTLLEPLVVQLKQLEAAFVCHAGEFRVQVVNIVADDLGQFYICLTCLVVMTNCLALSRLEKIAGIPSVQHHVWVPVLLS